MIPTELRPADGVMLTPPGSCAMRVNGLYGHVRTNDARSLALFAGFVAAFHLLAMLALVVPLAMYDPDHAPLYGWTGYLVRWVPIATVIGAVLFAVQMAWHVRTVRRRTDFRFVAGGGSLIEVVTGMAIESIAIEAELGYLDRTQPGADRIASCLHDLQQLPRPLQFQSVRFSITACICSAVMASPLAPQTAGSAECCANRATPRAQFLP